MEKEFKPTNAEKFTKGPNPQPTPEEAKKMKEDSYNIMKEDIEFMRLKGEYETLQIQAYENAVLLGRIEPTQVPGMLGMELMKRDLETQQWLYRYKAGLEQAIKEQEQMQKAAEESKQDNKEEKK